jgi:lysophospholipase L1-like esterase
VIDRNWLPKLTLQVLALGWCPLAACSAPAAGGSEPAHQPQAGSAANLAGTGGSSGSSTGGVGTPPVVSGGAGSGGQVMSGGASPVTGGAGSGGQLGGSAGDAMGGAPPMAGNAGQGWVGTWATAQQLTETANNPPSPGLADNTLRQIVRVSIGGKRLRLRFSNEYGSSPVTLKKVHCAVATSASSSAITAVTDKELAFEGAASVTIPAKAAVFSDPFDFALAPLSTLAVSINFGAVSTDVTGHPGSRTTSYLQAGDQVAAASLTGATADHWYVLAGVDVMADSTSHAVVILGDSITDGRGSTTNANDRWPDALAQRLQANASTTAIGVINKGIGGNNVLSDGLGPPATARFEADVLKQSGARWLIVFEGVNDLGTATATGAATTTSSLIAAYQQFVSKAHAANMLAFGATILPFKGHSYYTPEHETARTTVNDWIRKPGNFDAVIDLDAVARDAAQPDTVASAYDSGDHLHLNPTGYKKLADAVDLTLFK